MSTPNPDAEIAGQPTSRQRVQRPTRQKRAPNGFIPSRDRQATSAAGQATGHDRYLPPFPEPRESADNQNVTREGIQQAGNEKHASKTPRKRAPPRAQDREASRGQMKIAIVPPKPNAAPICEPRGIRQRTAGLSRCTAAPMNQDTVLFQPLDRTWRDEQPYPVQRH